MASEKNISLVICTILILFILGYNNNMISSAAAIPSNNSSKGEDIFGIKEIYPTRPDGREWFLNSEDPRSDGIFYITSDKNITKQSDGSWLINSSEVRMNVDTPPGLSEWKNVEITGYARILSVIDPSKENDLAWFARSGIHSNKSPCEGTGLIGGIHTDGTVEWKKEILFREGYTDGRDKAKVVVDPIIGRWIGWKVVMYNTNNNSAVKMESYIDNKDTNYWVQVTNLTDNGGWSAKSSDEKFYSTNCNKPKDYILTNGGPIVTFRSDNLVWEFKDLSV
ncbi:MAG: hypothetical protein WAL42_12295, partial [Nitrososphaeraceae archaeon]